MSYIIAAAAASPEAIVEQAKAAALSRFRLSSVLLSQMVNTAYANLLASGKSTADGARTLANNMGRLNNIAAQVNAGDVNQIKSYGKVAEGLIEDMNDTAGESIWSNVPSLEQELDIIMNIPQVIADSVVAVAKTTGRAVKAVAEGAGIDPSKMPGLSNTLDKVLLGVGLLAGAVILTQLGPIIRFVVPNRKNR